MQRRMYAGVLLLGLWLLGATSYAHASSATDGVKAILTKAMDIQSQPDLQGQEQRATRARLTRQLIADNFLAADMAKASLKEQWATLPPAKRQEFEGLFIDLFQDAYTRMVLNYLRRETVEYQGEQPEPDGVQVQTRITRASEHIPVVYALVHRDGRWLIRDVNVDGVSIVGNYHSQFRRAIQAKSFDDLLQKMRLQSQAIKDTAS